MSALRDDDDKERLAVPEEPGGQPGGQQGAVIYDLGYKPYEGTRRSQATRYRIMVRYTVSSAWKGFWRMKAWVFTAALTAFVIGTIMYVGGNQMFPLAGRAGERVTVGEALLPYSFQFFRWSAFALSLSVVAGLVARDLKSGAFEFYFSRPVRPVDYVLGKVGAALLIMGAVFFVCPTLLALFRIGMVGTDSVLSALPLVPKTALVGALATVAYATVPLAFSASLPRPRHTVAAWAAFHFLLGPIMVFISAQTGVPALAALDLSTAVNAVALALFDLQNIGGPPQAPVWAGAAVLAGYSTAAVAFVYRRVASAQRAGMGGG